MLRYKERYSIVAPSNFLCVLLVATGVGRCLEFLSLVL